MSYQNTEILENLIREIKSCRICESSLPLGPKPVFSVGPESKILVIGQAPGTKVHATGIPWNDLSGKELRRWLDVDAEVFYDTGIFSIIPMGLCYPGRGKRGDLPPRPECAPTWHNKLWQHLPNIKLTLLIGQYAHAYYLGKRRKSTLTDTVRSFEDYLPHYFPLIHPSPRNKFWHQSNPWFEQMVVPVLREKVRILI
ncbi:uracil-DNA glycosylase family protein [Cecembia rubra]|uniref:Uracil-DNA glycosylase n=1 Tax=Cecembia rubra TaxID=1485585 RepID=A0A2P8EE55_9BACT|nr:uracil-DNA glycosylase family protein [Cecembia rubra]PSL07766.1 uracil-DNA glycosylase [Cecembia rubra]